jgi:hypothetical protein
VGDSEAFSQPRAFVPMNLAIRFKEKFDQSSPAPRARDGGEGARRSVARGEKSSNKQTLARHGFAWLAARDGSRV